MAKLFLTVANSLEELVIEYCHPMLTTITFTAMSRLSNLTVHILLDPKKCRCSMINLPVTAVSQL